MVTHKREDTMNKQQMIKNLRKLNPLRSISSWNKESIKHLQSLHDEAIKLGMVTA